MSWFRRKKKNFEVTALPHFEEEYSPKSHSASEENMCYESIDNMWSWVKRDSIHYTFKRYEPAIRGFLGARLPSINSPLSSEDRSVILSFVTLQSFAYSYYLVMDLKDSIPTSISINEVTNTMVEVFFECHYIGEERISDTDTINIMISEKEKIVSKTLGKLLANS